MTRSLMKCELGIALAVAALVVGPWPAAADEPGAPAGAVPAALATAPGEGEDGLVRRWDHPDNYDQLSLPGKIGTNVRDGAVNLVDSVGQGLVTGYSVVLTGVALPKAATFVGDVVGLVDNNAVTKHVLNGVLSRHLLRLGIGSRGAPRAAAFIHDSEWDIQTASVDAYIGDTYFHPEPYAHPSIVGGLVGVIIGDIVVRPVGSIVTIFGGRETGKRIDARGLRIIEDGFRFRFP